ncbi:MAG: hypothetical protein HFG30_09440 [Eubacterium sp.]|jgi:preprotein translocase subunit SecG|nr:hypothetical protein [Eubacterium sp.]MCI9616798.1 hypothetical protein [Eubacterium sp.]
MTEEKKIKIGKICNHINTVLFILFFINVCVIPIMNKMFFMISTPIIVILFSVSCIVSHVLLKDYKPE